VTSAEYHATRVLPERRRATRNGKRALDSFVQSIRDRTVVEHPEWLYKFDNEIGTRLGILYFYFTKYILARWAPEGVSVCAIFEKDGKIQYTDNLLEDKCITQLWRTSLQDVWRLSRTKQGRRLLEAV
jgi:hypothetical protein